MTAIIETSRTPVSFSEASQMVETLLTVPGQHLVPFIEGKPGTGKSEMIQGIAKKLNMRLSSHQLISWNTVDVKGCPDVEEYTKWVMLEMFQADEPTLMFLDEFPQAMEPVQLSIQQPIQERKIGDKPISDNIYFVLAGNSVGERCGVRPVFSHVKNRMCHILLSTGHEEWDRWAVENGIDHRMLAWLRTHPDYLIRFDPNSTEPGFPSPRSNTNLASVLSHIGEINWSNENLASLCYSLAEGYIGAEAAHSLIGHMQATAKGMDPRSVLADPEGVEVKDEAELYGLIGSVVAVVSQSKAPRKKLMQEYFKWLKRLPDEHLVCGLRDMQIASKRIGNEEFFQLPIVHKWIKQNQAVFL